MFTVFFFEISLIAIDEFARTHRQPLLSIRHNLPQEFLTRYLNKFGCKLEGVDLEHIALKPVHDMSVAELEIAIQAFTSNRVRFVPLSRYHAIFERDY